MCNAYHMQLVCSLSWGKAIDSQQPISVFTSFLLSSGIQSIPPQGGKLEIAGMVVGQWAGNKPVRGRGGFNMQVVSVGAGRG